jgi:arylsulfatase A-like enzyme
LKRRQFLQTMFAASALAQTRTERPNVIVILADDMGYGDLSCYGSPYIRTPHLDRMASEGVRFTDFYAQPLCGPSRAAFMTGCYPVRNSLMFNHLPRAKTGIHANEVTIAQQMKKAGYSTSMIGKWHLGDAPPFLPTRHGFDSYFGLPYSNDMWPFHPKIVRTPGENPRLTAGRKRAEMTGYDGQGQTYPVDWFPPLPLIENERVVETNPDLHQLTRRYTDRALSYIGAHRSEPFFLYLAHAMPHVPLFASGAYEGKSRRGLYGDAVSELDGSTGEILAALKRLGLDERTLVVFYSDNGPWLPYGIDAGSAGPLHGGKGTPWEGSLRVPAIFRWPGHIEAGRVSSEFAASIDLFPTVSRLAGVAVPSDRTIDGRDIGPLLFDATARSPHEYFFIYEGSIQYQAAQGRPVNKRVLQAVRSGRWKLHVESKALYDLYSDIGESKNVADRNPDVVARLMKAGADFDREVAEHVRPLGTL